MKSLILFLILSLTSSLANAQPLKSIYLNNQGSEALSSNNSVMAQRNFLKALSENPNNHIARLNLGLSFILNKEIEMGIKEFKTPLKSNSQNKEVLYFANFNIGRSYHDLKKTEEALKHYQDSLKYKKDSLQAKANIEMLVQQMQGQGKGGSGDEQQNQKNKDQNQQGQGDQKDQKKDQQQDGDKPDEKNKKPKKPQDLSDKDIEKILEELKNQEQKIRALEYGKKSKEDSNGKTW